MQLASLPRIGLIWLAPVFLLPVAPAARAQLTYFDTVVALLGDTAPAAGGGTYSTFNSASVNASGDMAFSAFIASGFSQRMCFPASAARIAHRA